MKNKILGIYFLLTIFSLSDLGAVIHNQFEVMENSLFKPSEQLATFTPPSGWYFAEEKSLESLPKVKVMVIGKGSYTLPPSMNLSMEPFKGTLKQYLKIVKKMNDDRGCIWKDLGVIRTQAGTGSLSQVDTKTQWGENRQMHTILLKNGTIYILTASAMKDEFSLFYKDFFNSMRSLRIANNFYDTIPNDQQKEELKTWIKKLHFQWQTLTSQSREEANRKISNECKEELFSGEFFQSSSWHPFEEFLKQKYINFGDEWKKMVEKKVKDELFALQDENPNSAIFSNLKES